MNDILKFSKSKLLKIIFIIIILSAIILISGKTFAASVTTKNNSSLYKYSESSKNFIKLGVYINSNKTITQSNTGTAKYYKKLEFNVYLHKTCVDQNTKEVANNSNGYAYLRTSATFSGTSNILGKISNGTSINCYNISISKTYSNYYSLKIIAWIRKDDIKANQIAVTSVTLDVTSANLNIGNTKTLTPTIKPSNASNKNMTWTSSNTAVATVSSKGVVTALKAGETTITVKTTDEKKTSTCKVIVKKSSSSTTNSGSTNNASQTNVYLTHYKPTDDNNGNFATAYVGTVLKKKNGIIYIAHENVSTNSKGWYTYTYNNTKYVILARLKNTSNSYCGFEKCEIVKFVYNGVTYNGVILDCGGARRSLPTLDIFVKTTCTDCPDLVKTTATGTNKYITVKTNY